MSGGDAPRLGARLREKLPEILIEAVSVVFALLLAFAINAWHDRVQDDERADDARRAILAELHANADEVRASVTVLQRIVGELKANAPADAPGVKELHVDLGLSLLSSAAWRAALATQASRRIPFDWMTRIAKLYELQDAFLRLQANAVDQLAAMPAGGGKDPHEVAASLLPRMDALRQLAEGLLRSYDDEFADPAVQQTPD